MERRSYYRIKDTVGLRFSVLNDSAQQLPASANLPVSALVSQLADVDNELNQLVNVLWQENPVIAKAMGLLNRKLSLLTEHALPGEESVQTGAGLEDWLVSLSGSGIGFEYSEALAACTRLALSLWLRPSNIDLHLTGVVIASELLANSSPPVYWIQVAFEEGNEAAQERLIQHVVQRQCVKGVENSRVPDA